MLPITATAALPTGPVTRVLPSTETTTSETSPALTDAPKTDTTTSARSPAARVESCPTLTITFSCGGVGAAAAATNTGVDGLLSSALRSLRATPVSSGRQPSAANAADNLLVRFLIGYIR